MDNTHYITGLLQRWKVQGDGAAEEELFRAVQRELLRLAQNALSRNRGFGHKLDPHELLNEAYLALKDYPIVTANRGPFFALMARAMRNVLMDIGRRDRAAKRPSTAVRVMDTHAMDSASVPPVVDAIAYYETFDLLNVHYPRAARILEQVAICGMTIDESSAENEISPATVKRDLTVARAFFRTQLERAKDPA